MFKDILVPLIHTRADMTALGAAARHARTFGAHLTALEAIRLPVASSPGLWGVTPNTGMAEVWGVLRDDAREHAEKCRGVLSAYDISSEVRQVESMFVNPDECAAEHARHADLTIMGSTKPGAAVVHEFFSALLLDSGRPVLVVPEHHVMKPLKRAVVAWRPTAQARRAVHDALPFLYTAEMVDVVEIGPRGTYLDDGNEPGADIATHLARHGLKVNVVVHAQHQETVASALLRHCAYVGAELLVVGGYGHSRLREYMLGGTTRELVEFGDVPMLFSH